MKSRLRGDAARSPSASESTRSGEPVVTPARGTIGWLLGDQLARDHDAIRGTDFQPSDASTGSLAEPALRRIESGLRIFGSVFDSRAAGQLLQELAWIGSLSSAVSEHRVLADRVRGQLAALDRGLLVGPVEADVELVLDVESGAHLERLGAAVGSERYRRLLQSLEDWRAAPPFTSEAAEPFTAVDAYLRRAADAFDRRLTEALLDADPEALQEVRRAGRVLAQAAEIGGPQLGRQATKRVRRVRRLEALLDEHHASTQSAEFLARVGPVAGLDSRHNGFTYGLLYEQEHRWAAGLRARLEEKRR